MNLKEVMQYARSFDVDQSGEVNVEILKKQLTRHKWRGFHFKCDKESIVIVFGFFTIKGFFLRKRYPSLDDAVVDVERFSTQHGIE